MKCSTSLWDLEALVTFCNGSHARMDGHRALPPRLPGYTSARDRFRVAWLVFTGRADAIIWPEIG